MILRGGGMLPWSRCPGQVHAPEGGQIRRTTNRDAANQLRSHPETVLFLTFKMLQTQMEGLGKGKAAQQAVLLPLLRKKAKGKVPAGRGHLDPAGKGSSSFYTSTKALGLGQCCRKATAHGVPRPPQGLGGGTAVLQGSAPAQLHPWIDVH